MVMIEGELDDCVNKLAISNRVVSARAKKKRKGGCWKC